MGTGLTGKTFGSIGLGNIAREAFTLAKPLEMRQIAHDPYASPEQAAELGVELVDLDTLLRTADVVSITCALTPETHHLLNAERLAMMKPTAYLISAARGPIVDQRALTEALRNNGIAGAGLDVFEEEPVDPNDPILTLDNVIVSPPRSLLDRRVGRRGQGAAPARPCSMSRRDAFPPYVVNREAIEEKTVQEKLAQYAKRREG